MYRSNSAEQPCLALDSRQRMYEKDVPVLLIRGGTHTTECNNMNVVSTNLIFLDVPIKKYAKTQTRQQWHDQ